ncbi:MAG: Pr6Pr family membrane protein [Clostridia bacterium]|nr:Pr6Pr family membrane protein [Clostridia bacterium]
MNRRRVSFVYRLGTITSLFLGIVLSFATTTNARYLLSYYTTQSNLLCLVVFVFLFIGDLIGYDYQKRKVYYFLKGTITIAILVTAIVYVVALLPNDLPMYTVSSREAERWGKIMGNLLVHVISPLLVTVDYYFLDEKGNFKFFYPTTWLFFPVLYVCFVYSGKGKFYRIGGSKKFGYFFLDYEKIGIEGVIIWLTMIAIGIMVLGYTLLFIDRKFAKNKTKDNTS